MNTFSEAEFNKIINDCEILILPENSTIEEVLKNESKQFSIKSSGKSSNPSKNNEIVTINNEKHSGDNEEDFKRIYEFSKAKSRGDVIIEKPMDYSHLRSAGKSSMENKKSNSERAQLINGVLKENLLNFRRKILAIIEKIDIQYRKNNLFLEEARHCDKNEVGVKSTYIKCGAPYFKDALSCPAPFNQDYLYRKNVLKEFFPFDLPKTSSRWKTKDKIALIIGVKHQMISYIKSQQSQKYSKEVRKTRGRIQKLKFMSQSQDLNNSSMLDVYQIIQEFYPDFSINWNIISFNDLSSKHSVYECMGMWYSYLRPDINREPFTEEENLKITSAYAENNYNSWADIANSLNNRSSLQTFVHFHSTFARFCPSNIRWSEEEDSVLLQLVKKHSINGVINWQKIGQVMANRNKKQCYNRYIVITKRQGIKRGVFTPSEDRKIINFVKQFGEMSFHKMSVDFIPGRSKAQIKTHYDVALKHQGNINPWTKEEDKKLIDFIENSGPKWFEIAEILKTHNRISCRTRYVTIKKYLARNPNASLEDVPNRMKTITAVQRANITPSNEDESNDRDSDVDMCDDKSPQIKEIGKKTSERSKALSLEFYKIMKTTFNYDLGARAARDVLVDNEKLLMLMRLFNVEDKKLYKNRNYMLTTNQMMKIMEVQGNMLNEVLSNEIKFVTAHTQFLMPPNYNTVIGLRALTIKTLEEPLPEDDTLKDINQNSDFKESLVKFQKLYFSLFYWSAMLKKIENAELNAIHFLKYPKANLASTNIFDMLKLNKRMLPVSTRFMVKRKNEEPKSHLLEKRRKI